MNPTTHTVLVVDDEPHMRRLVQFNLTRLGYKVTTAAGGAEALARLAAEEIDLVILDVVMPGMDGFAVLRTLRQDAHHRSLPVVMLTARGQAEVEAEASALGVQAFITKPFSPTALGRTVAGLLAGPGGAEN